MRGTAVRINAEHAQALLLQFQETARYRDWQLLAVAIMTNHIHLVVEADGAVDPIKILGDFKAYGAEHSTKNGRNRQAVLGGPPRARNESSRVM